MIFSESTMRRRKQESDDHFAEEQMETKTCIEESNQEGIENKESNRKSQVTTSGLATLSLFLKTRRLLVE